MADLNRSAILEQLQTVVQYYKDNPNCELEGSLGICKEGKFTSGVDYKYFKELLETLLESKVWSSREDWHHFATYYYDDHIRGRYNVHRAPVFIAKHTLANITLGCSDRIYDLRITASEELKQSQNTTIGVRPKHVRLHERSSFIYKHNWRYDFSKVVSGKTKESACASDPRFEIELELLRAQEYIDQSVAELSENVLNKLIDLLGRFDLNHQPIPCTLEIQKTYGCSMQM